MGNGALPLCNDVHAERPATKVHARAFSVYAGSIPTTAPIPANLAGFAIPKMAQVLAENPQRVGLFIKANASGVLVHFGGNGTMVSMTEVFGNDPSTGDQFREFMGLDQQARLVDSMWVAIVNVAAYPNDQMMLSGIELIAD